MLAFFIFTVIVSLIIRCIHLEAQLNDYREFMRKHVVVKSNINFKEEMEKELEKDE